MKKRMQWGEKGTPPRETRTDTSQRARLASTQTRRVSSTTAPRQVQSSMRRKYLDDGISARDRRWTFTASSDERSEAGRPPGNSKILARTEGELVYSWGSWGSIRRHVGRARDATDQEGNFMSPR